MRLKLGLTKEEKLVIAIEKYSDWHRHFVWWPKRVGRNDYRWLETIWRKGEWDQYKERWKDWEYAVVIEGENK